MLGGIFLVLYIVATGFLLAARLFIFPSFRSGWFLSLPPYLPASMM